MPLVSLIKNYIQENPQMLGYIFTIISYAVYCVGRYCKNKSGMLYTDILSKIIASAGFLYLRSYTAVGNMLGGIAVLCMASLKEKKHKKWTLMYVLLELMYVVILLNTMQGISSLIIFITSTISLYNIWWYTPQKMRVVGIVNSIIYIGFQISIKNWAGFLEIFVISSNISSYLKYRKESSKEFVEKAVVME